MRRVTQDLDLGLVAYSGLAGGLLTGKYRDGVPTGSRAAAAGLEFFRPSFVSTQRNEIVDNLSDIATGIGVSLAHLALAWCLNNPRVCSVALVVRA